jgi:hypothetical protein
VRGRTAASRHTPHTCAAAMAMVAIWLRSPHSARNVSVNACTREAGAWNSGKSRDACTLHAHAPHLSEDVEVLAHVVHAQRIGAGWRRPFRQHRRGSTAGAQTLSTLTCGVSLGSCRRRVCPGPPFVSDNDVCATVNRHGRDCGPLGPPFAMLRCSPQFSFRLWRCGQRRK